MARVRSRLLLVLAATTCLAAIDCGSDSSAVTTADNDGGVAEGDGGNDGGPSTDGAPLGDAASGTIDVNGTVGTSGISPRPIANLAIIDATGTAFKTTSAADGTFHVAGVTTPYDVLVTYDSPDGGDPVYPYYFGGLTRPDPAVYGRPETSTDPDPLPPERTAPITYTANACVGCTIWGSAPDAQFRQPGTGVSKAYTDSYRWHATSPTLATTLHFYFQDATGEFTGHTDRTVTLTDATAADLGTISPSPIPTNPTLAVNATLPSGYTYDRTGIEFYGTDRARIAYMNPTTTSSTTKILAVSGVQVQLYASATGPDGISKTNAFATWPDYTAVPNTLAVPLPEIPKVISPADKATGITSTQKLTWTPWSLNGVYYIEIVESSGRGLTVRTMTPEVDLARLAKAGLTLTSGHVYYWSYAMATSDGSLDDMTRPGGPPVQAQGTLNYIASGINRSFTMQ